MTVQDYLASRRINWVELGVAVGLMLIMVLGLTRLLNMPSEWAYHMAKEDCFDVYNRINLAGTGEEVEWRLMQREVRMDNCLAGK